MKQLLLAGVAMFGFAGMAAAADLPNLPVKAPPLAVPYNWSGFYLGLNAGYGLGVNDSANGTPITGDLFTTQPAGGFGGAQAGVNWQMGRWVFGLETDFQGAAMRDSQTCLFLCNSAASMTLEQKLNWFGTTRARVGMASGPIYSYVTGGLAYGEVSTTVNETIAPLSGSFTSTSTRTGWTYGGGVEAALDGNWSAKAEYLFVDLGSTSNAFTTAGFPNALSTHWQSHIFRGGVNYRFWGGGGGTVLPAAANWAGLYIGGNGGSGYARNTSNIAIGAPFGPLNSSFDLAPTGFLGGVQAGYNWQFGRAVFGVETDIQGSFQKDDRACVLGCSAIGSAQIDQKMPWFGTTRARLGYSVGPSLFYVTGGVAYGGVKTKITEQAPTIAPATFSFSDTKTGWTAGAGIEQTFDFFGLFGPNWTMRTEYLYVDLGSVSNSYSYALGSPHTFNTSVHEHIWRSALSYKFGEPVVAR